MSNSLLKNNPIGIFDSGLGGLSVMKAIRTMLPAENLIYFGDCDNAPYGDRTEEFIAERSLAITNFLLTRGAKAIVVACNTATAVAVAEIRARHSLPVIGIEPAVKPAIAASKSGVVGVMATTRTLSSRKYASLIERFHQNGVSVIPMPCPGLMDCVEAGDWTSKHTLNLIKKYVSPLREAGCDQIVLGCTHYPFLRTAIQNEAGQGIRLIDPSDAIAKELKSQLSKRNIACPEKQGKELFWVSGQITAHEAIVSTLWGKPVSLNSLA